MDFACNAFVCSRFLERDEKRDIRESTSQNGSLSQREREKELSFPLLKISKLKRRKELEIVVYVAREDTHTQRERGEREVSFRLVSAREEYKKTQYIMITWSNNSAPFVARQNASINLLASSHRRSDVTSYSTFGKYTCQSRGESTVSRCASGVSLVVAMRFVVAPELVVFLHFCTTVCKTRVKNVSVVYI